MHEPLTNIRKVILLVLERDVPATEVWRALYGAAVLHRAAGKYVIAVNDDIDPENADAILWAMSYRANPRLDLHVLPHRDQGHGPRSQRNGGEDASLLIDATLKEDFPPISLPKRPYMERAKALWEELGLPPLKPEAPWFGYSLGRLAGRARRGGEPRHARRVFRDRQGPREAPAQGRAHEHRGAARQATQAEGALGFRTYHCVARAVCPPHSPDFYPTTQFFRFALLIRKVFQCCASSFASAASSRSPLRSGSSCSNSWSPTISGMAPFANGSLQR